MLELVSDARGLGLEFEYGLLGGCAIDATGRALPPETFELCQSSDAVLVGSVGGPKWDHLPADINPGPGGLLRLRRDFDLYANLRPGVAYLPDSVTVKTTDIDILLIREAVGGAYFSPNRGRREDAGEVVAWDTMEYTETQVRRIMTLACEMATRRSGRLANIDKSNVLDSSVLWREVALEVIAQYPDLDVEHLYVDNAAMQLLLRPETFDVMVTENLFGDILSDEIAGLVGSLGLLPSASLRGDRFGLYEPIHGSAPDIANTGKANPSATILSAALMLRYSLEREQEARLVETAVIECLQSGQRTSDVPKAGVPVLTTSEFGDAVRQRLARLLAG